MKIKIYHIIFLQSIILSAILSVIVFSNYPGPDTDFDMKGDIVINGWYIDSQVVGYYYDPTHYEYTTHRGESGVRWGVWYHSKLHLRMITDVCNGDYYTDSNSIGVTCYGKSTYAITSVSREFNDLFGNVWTESVSSSISAHP